MNWLLFLFLGIKFCQVFFDTMTKEWHGIDRLRLDKYYMVQYALMNNRSIDLTNRFVVSLFAVSLKRCLYIYKLKAGPEGIQNYIHVLLHDTCKYYLLTFNSIQKLHVTLRSMRFFVY